MSGTEIPRLSWMPGVGARLAVFGLVWALGEKIYASSHRSWIEIARAFDPEMANQHVEYLASPELAGRQAGSPGAEIAAAYIAARFAEYGLLPVGESAACERVEGRRYAGANDDASGVGVLLEIARLWHETGYRPQYSVLCQKIELPPSFRQ